MFTNVLNLHVNLLNLDMTAEDRRIWVCNWLKQPMYAGNPMLKTYLRGAEADDDIMSNLTRLPRRTDGLPRALLVLFFSAPAIAELAETRPWLK